LLANYVAKNKCEFKNEEPLALFAITRQTGLNALVSLMALGNKNKGHCNKRKHHRRLRQPPHMPHYGPPPLNYGLPQLNYGPPQPHLNYVSPPRYGPL